ncbi:hypothetical protein [Sphaerospermopsis kisseleviana]|jgi:hypothetical protein|nr:hypothetical protein [Sphaerospermopsis kisseleviana]
METITINSHVGQDGILHLDIPVNISNADLTVTIIVTGLTQNRTKVGVIHELPLRQNQVFSPILRKSYVKHNDNFQQENKPKGKGWPANFFEETSGCLKYTPLIIDSEGVFDDLEDFK